MPGLLLTYSSDVRCYIGMIFNVYRILSGLGKCRYVQGSILIICDLRILNCAEDDGQAWKSFHILASYYFYALLFHATHVSFLFSAVAYLWPSLRDWSVMFYNLCKVQCFCLLVFYCFTVQTWNIVPLQCGAGLSGQFFVHVHIHVL